ncbi:hypothetical protein [Streptomyces sp. CBMA123]|uniref:hypothetical protein n=1 Tax=Streptomyces sp. CBMA123 TaxID=1896313 RepID=UPI001661B3A0|nr:hypothetical protein [Streptomyces sp. CBMA123]
MISNPHIVFDTDPEHGLLARSGWEQEEARTVLRDLGWEWQEELHALVPPTDAPDVDAGVQAVEQLHLHGYLTGYAVGRFGVMRLPLDRAEQVLTKAVVQQTPGPRPDTAPYTPPTDTAKPRYSAGGGAAVDPSPESPSALPL